MRYCPRHLQPVRDSSGRASTAYGSECGPVAGSSNQIGNEPVMLGDLCQLLFLASLHLESHAALASFYRVIFPCPPRSVVALVDPLGDAIQHYEA